MALSPTTSRGLPRQWTTDAQGALLITSTGASGDDDFANEIVVTNADNHVPFYVDSSGTVYITQYDTDAVPLNVDLVGGVTAIVVEEDGLLNVARSADIRSPSTADQPSLRVYGRAGYTSALVQVHNHAGALIFTVNADGSLHGKTGQSLTFDL